MESSMDIKKFNYFHLAVQIAHTDTAVRLYFFFLCGRMCRRSSTFLRRCVHICGTGKSAR